MNPNHKKKVVNISLIVLKTIAASGIIAMALVAPNSLKAIELFQGKKRDQRRAQYYIKNVATRLARQGYVNFVERDGKKFLEITPKGELAILKHEKQGAVLKKPKRWDKKWRIVIFDIPQKRRGARDFLREFLETIGFYMLHQSVWIYPHDCEELITLFKAQHNLHREVLYMEVSRLEADKKLREKFKV